MTTDDIVNAEPPSRTLTIDLDTGRWLAGGPMLPGDGERIASTVLPGTTPELIREWYGRWLSDDPAPPVVLDDFTRRRQEREGFTVRDGGSTSRGVFFDPRPADADCDLPPAGWLCTKVAGHDGPCPTIPAPDRA